MATDQPTTAEQGDAAARERVWAEIYRYARTDTHPSAAELNAALDTLIRYHRAQSAVEAWDSMGPLLHAVGCLDTLMDQFELYEPWYAASEARAAAQERLAAYAKETA